MGVISGVTGRKEKHLHKKGDHFSILPLSWDYMSNRNPHVGACVSSTALYTGCLGLGFSKQRELEFNIIILLSLCMCLG